MVFQNHIRHYKQISVQTYLLLQISCTLASEAQTELRSSHICLCSWFNCYLEPPPPKKIKKICDEYSALIG